MPWIVTAVTAAGCGGSLASVTGKVSEGGSPVTGAVICFVPSRGPLAQSPLGAGGEYRLTTPGGGGGVAPGQYRVYLQAMPSEAEELAKANIKESDLVGRKVSPSPAPTIPAAYAKYYSATTTDWVRDVEPGSNEFDFELK